MLLGIIMTKVTRHKRTQKSLWNPGVAEVGWTKIAMQMQHSNFQWKRRKRAPQGLGSRGLQKTLMKSNWDCYHRNAWLKAITSKMRLKESNKLLTVLKQICNLKSCPHNLKNLFKRTKVDRSTIWKELYKLSMCISKSFSRARRSSKNTQNWWDKSIHLLSTC